MQATKHQISYISTAHNEVKTYEYLNAHHHHNHHQCCCCCHHHCHNCLPINVLVLYLDICVLMHSSAGLITGPAMLSLHINNLDSRNMTHQYTQEPVLSLNHFYFNMLSATDVMCFYYLFSMCLCLWLVIYFLVRISQYIFHSSWYYRIWHRVMYVGGLQLAQVHRDIIPLMYEFQYLFQSIVDYVPVWLLYWALLGSVCNQLQEWFVTSYMTDPSSMKTARKSVYCTFRE